MTRPKLMPAVKPDPAEDCKGRLRYPALDGARTAASVLRGIGRAVGEPRRCKTCSGYHLAEAKQATRGRAA